MTDFPISSQVSWVDHYKEQKLYFSNAMEKVSIHSEDGFTFTLPTHALLASSRLVQRICSCGEEGVDILLPSVSGATLSLLIELLRCGVTSVTGSIGSMSMNIIKEIQVVMEQLDIEGFVTITKNTICSRKSRTCEQVESDSRRLEIKGLPSTSNLPVLKTKKAEVASRPEQVSKYCDRDHVKEKRDEFEEKDLENCKGKKLNQNACHVCGKKFKSKGSWRAHIRFSHKDALFSCADCGKKFIFEHTMKLHVEAVHTGSATCDYCQNRFRNTASLNTHIRRIHRDKMIPCSNCSISFRNGDNLAYHMEKFHPETNGPFVCEECCLTFDKNCSLQHHMTNVHSGICHIYPECRSTFITKYNLSKHVKSMHGNSVEVVGIAEPDEYNENVKRDGYSDEDNNLMTMKQENTITED